MNQHSQFEGVQNISGYLGHVVLHSDGAIKESDGDMANCEELANMLYNLYVKCSSFPTENGENVRRVSVNYDDYFYSMMSSNGRVYIVKRQQKLQEPASA